MPDPIPNEVTSEPAAKRQRTADDDSNIQPEAPVSSSSVAVKSEPSEEDSKPAARGDSSVAVKMEPPNIKTEENANIQPKDKVMLEFKFSSYKTQLFKDGALKGTLQVQMEQDPVSGLYSIPVGKTPFQVALEDTSVKTENWCSGRNEFNTFQGTFSRDTEGGPIEMTNSGLTLDYASGNHRNFQARVRPHDVERQGPLFSDEKVSGSVKFRGRNLLQWEQEQGGFLELVASVDTEWSNSVRWGYYGGTFDETRAADGSYKIKLYTVLSAYKSEQREDELPDYTTGQTPDWNALVDVVAARNPSKDRSWAKNAVQQYQHYMTLKAEPRTRKQKLSPSYAVDEIWHAHLSFTDRYQHDLICLTRGNGIVEHLPTHFKYSTKYYKKAHDLHTKRMAKEGKELDAEFWPEPTDYDPSVHATDSDNEKMEGYVLQGKPSRNSGCSGCAGCG